MKDEAQEISRDGSKCNFKKLTPHHDEIFADLAPEFRTLARGWFWRQYRAAPISEDSCSGLFSVVLISVLSLLAYHFVSYFFPPADTVEVASQIFAALIIGCMVALAIMCFDVKLRDFLIKRKAANYTLEECKETAIKVLVISKTFQELEVTDPALVKRAVQYGLDEESVNFMIKHYLGQIYVNAKDIARGLLSPKVEDRARAFANLAGQSIPSIGHEVRIIRKQQTMASELINSEIAKKELDAETERLYREIESQDRLPEIGKSTHG